MNLADPRPLDPNTILPTVVELENQLGAQWTALRQCREHSAKLWMELESGLRDVCSSDVSVVPFGSIARGETTVGSDADWLFLVDGQSHPDHPEAAQAIGEFIHKTVGKDPGAEGVFGKMAFSHELVHLIGVRTTRTRT